MSLSGGVVIGKGEGARGVGGTLFFKTLRGYLSYLFRCLSQCKGEPLLVQALKFGVGVLICYKKATSVFFLAGDKLLFLQKLDNSY